MPAPSRKTEVLTPSRLRARRRRTQMYKTAILAVLLVTLLLGCVGFFYIPALRVREVAVIGAQSVPAGEVEVLLREKLSGRKWYVLPGDNAFLYNEGLLQERSMHVFPKIKSVDIELINFHRIEAKIQERAPSGLWCGDSKENPTSCMYFDDGGIVYEAAPDFSGDAYIRWYGKIFGEVPHGEYLGGQLPSLHALISEFEKEGIRTRSVAVKGEGDVDVVYEGDFTLMFTLAQKPETILEALHAAKGSEVLKDKQLTDLQYLDLRFLGNRLYYKFK